MRVMTILACAVLALTASAADSNVKGIFGWVETVAVGSERVVMSAKLDTGATTSSLHATAIQRFRRGGRRYVRFTLSDGNDGLGPRLEQPLVRMVRIKKHTGDYERRPVVKLPVCLGDSEHVVEFSLVDRSNFDQPVLLGRSALSGFALVDPQIDSTTLPVCGSATS
jgi:hypothetical protein